MRIRENIIALRKKRNDMSRGALGRLLDPPVARQTIEKLENGEIPLTVDWLEKIATALGVDPAALVVGESGEFALTEQVAVEVARTLVNTALPGVQVAPANVLVLSVMLGQLVEMFARYPATRTDVQALRPALDILVRQHGRPAS